MRRGMRTSETPGKSRGRGRYENEYPVIHLSMEPAASRSSRVFHSPNDLRTNATHLVTKTICKPPIMFGSEFVTACWFSVDRGEDVLEWVCKLYGREG